VSIFRRTAQGFALDQTVLTVSPPVSVAFGHDHLYVLGTTSVESHELSKASVDATNDGAVALLRADGSAAQVGVVGDQLLITEKSGAVEVVELHGGAVSGPVSEVALHPGSDTPLGLVSRGANGYVTIAHSDEIVLVKNGAVESIVATGSNYPSGPGQQAPCWLALVGPYLFSSNSPSHSISRVIATGHNLMLEEPIAAQTVGTPTDIVAHEGLLAVIESNGGGQSHLTQFHVDDDGNLLPVTSTLIQSRANGVAIVER
jgi:hypothetical protein